MTDTTPAPSRIRSAVAALIGDAKPATDRLLQSLAESVRDVREHDHPAINEDLYCSNLTSFMGDRMAVVLRRLLDAEAEVESLRAERNTAVATVADQAKRLAQQEREHDADRTALHARPTRAEVLKAEATNLRRVEREDLPEGALGTRTGLLKAALILDERADDAATGKDNRTGESTRATEPVTAVCPVCQNPPCHCPCFGKSRAPHCPHVTGPELTVFRASYDSIAMGLYTSRAAARAHCEAYVRREAGDEMLLSWVPDDGSEDAPEELCTGYDVECTGYIVTPLTVASAYDEEADE